MTDPGHSMTDRLLVAGAISVLASCGPPATQVLLHVRAEDAVAARAHTLCITVESDGAEPQEQCARVSGDDAPAELPTTTPVLQREGSEGFTAGFQVFDATQASRRLLGEEGTPFLVTAAAVRYRESELLEVDILLEDACADVSCDGDAVCSGGACGPIPTYPP